VYAVPEVPLIPRFVNVATPDTAVAVTVPTSAPPVETVAVITVDESVVTVLPAESWMVTCGWVVNAAPDAVPTDCRVRESADGAPAVTVTIWAACVRLPEEYVIS
jgi:hypothetical protein